MLSLRRIPLPKIGSFSIDNFGILNLSNRPLTIPVQELENEGIPAQMRRESTYSAAQPYLLDLLAYHDGRIRFQRNAVFAKPDGEAQLAVLTAMRASLLLFASHDVCQTPYFMTLTDLHQSNIFIDDKWRVKALVDLEWTCSLPIGMQTPPYWLTNRHIDGFTNEHLDAFVEAHEEFVSTYEQTEMKLSLPRVNNTYSGADMMRKGLRTGSLWYFWAIDSPSGIFNLFDQHIGPRFPLSHNKEVKKSLAAYWSPDAFTVIDAKIKDKEVYDRELKTTLENAE